MEERIPDSWGLSFHCSRHQGAHRGKDTPPPSILKHPSYGVGGAVGMRCSSCLAVWEGGVHMNKPRQQSDRKLQRRKRHYQGHLWAWAVFWKEGVSQPHCVGAAQTEAAAHGKVWITVADPKAQVGIQLMGTVSWLLLENLEWARWRGIRVTLC